MTEALVTVVIPHYNRSTLLRAAVASVLQSQYHSVEIIIVDDGSSDLHRKEIATLESEVTRVIDREGGVKGPSRCRNMGAAASRGKYLVFLDSDDLMAPWCIEQRVAASNDFPHADLWVFPVMLFDNQPGDRDTLWNSMRTSEDDSIRFARSDPPWHTSSPLWRRDSFVRTSGFNEAVFYGDDSDLHLRTILSGFVIEQFPSALPDVFVRRSNTDRITSSISSYLVESRRARLREANRFLREAGAPEEVRNVFEGQYFIEVEYLLFNEERPRNDVRLVLDQWEAEGSTGWTRRFVVQFYAKLVDVAKDHAYIVVRVARRIVMFFLPRDWFSSGTTFEMAAANAGQLSEVRNRLRSHTGEV